MVWKVFSFDLFIDRTWLQLCKNHFLPQWLTSLNRKCSNVILTVMQSDLKDLQLLYEDLKSDLDSIYPVNVRSVDTELTSRVDVLWSEYTAVFAIVKAARRNFMSMPWIKNNVKLCIDATQLKGHSPDFYTWRSVYMS